MPQKINVLIVDDSAFMRKALKRMLNSDPMLKVIGEAKDGREAIAETRRLSPDVVTLDVKMSGMDGIEALKAIMSEKPTPVLMVSSLTSEGGELTLKALEAGAVDFIDKSSCHTTMDILEIADSLVQKVKIVAGVDLNKMVRAESAPAVSLSHHPQDEMPSDENPSHLVLIGTSTGGPMSLEQVLINLPQNYPGAILVVQHMPVGFTRSLAERLNNQCKMDVKEAEEHDPVSPGKIYIAPAGYHLMIKRCEKKFGVVLSKNPREAQHCPSVDVMMLSAAQIWPGPIMAVIMTGMGQDGTEGIKTIKQRGGTVIAQDEDSCVVFGMPKAAYLSGCVDKMVPLNRIPQEIYNFNNAKTR